MISIWTQADCDEAYYQEVITSSPRYEDRIVIPSDVQLWKIPNLIQGTYEIRGRTVVNAGINASVYAHDQSLVLGKSSAHIILHDVSSALVTDECQVHATDNSTVYATGNVGIEASRYSTVYIDAPTVRVFTSHPRSAERGNTTIIYLDEYGMYRMPAFPERSK